MKKQLIENLIIFILSLILIGVMFVTDTSSLQFVGLGLCQIALTYIMVERRITNVLACTSVLFGLIYVVAISTTQIMSAGFLMSLVGLFDLIIIFSEEVEF